MYLKMNGEEEVKIDVVDYNDAREYMFTKMEAMYENKEYERSYEMLEHTLNTMRIMEDARKNAGIYFGGNND